jgi:thioesterase domain-containing protein
MMSNSQIKNSIIDSLTETAEAHHKAFSATEGEDPDWAIWYADHLLDNMRKLLKANFTKSELIYLLVKADKEMGVYAPSAEWQSYYARFFLNFYIGER